MPIGLGTRGAHERRVPSVSPIVPISIVRPGVHAECGIKYLGPTHDRPRSNPSDRTSDGRARDASDANHHCPHTPGVLRSDEQSHHPSDGDAGEEDRLAHLATYWLAA